MGFVVRRYIDFLILLIPLLLYLFFFVAVSLLFVNFFNVCRSCIFSNYNLHQARPQGGFGGLFFIIFML